MEEKTDMRILREKTTGRVYVLVEDIVTHINKIAAYEETDVRERWNSVAHNFANLRQSPKR